ncbi:hypothetical protein VC83_04178 [Pseudogymnoascus destructans]|uniref:Uncharacterized protein n=1 Tax=Pseudogymnoascus destructans TaxID=655981 RepID=A0A177AAE6_9PEZI|nr:uncharacterized protein VC83_04178 [Pseudogymnoascus destructans]OAF59129.1 hypothetical protein VC83_04178 [Pseudogymnoascus destructans]
MPTNRPLRPYIHNLHERIPKKISKMSVPTLSGDLTVAFRVLYLRCLRAKARGIQSDNEVQSYRFPRSCWYWSRFQLSICVWFPTSSKCGYCTVQHSPCVPFAALLAAEEATPLIPADVVAAATEANRVALLAAQSMPKFRSEAERDLYEEARATRAALELGLAQIQSSLRRLRTEQESVPALLGELVVAVGKLPTTAAPAVAPTRGDGRREGRMGKLGRPTGPRWGKTLCRRGLGPGPSRGVTSTLRLSWW